jgi:polyisoprenoid-binding protein YceI
MAWELDSAHTHIGFSAKHMMVSTVRGQFNRFSGTLELDEEHPERSTVDVTIDVASVATGDEKRDGHLRSPDFFDAATYPTITFKSTKVEEPRDEQFRITGDLTIRGVTKPVTLDGVIEGQAKDYAGNRRAGFTLKTNINRKDWDLTWNVALEAGAVLVGERVTIEIDAEVVEQAAVTAGAEAQTAASA